VACCIVLTNHLCLIIVKKKKTKNVGSDEHVTLSPPPRSFGVSR